MDGLWGTVFGLSSLAAISDDEAGVGIALAGAGALFIASAVRGNNAANACRDEYSEYNASLIAQQRNMLAEQPLRPSPAVKKRPKSPPPDPQPVEPQVDPAPPATEPAPEYASPRPIVKSPVPIVQQPVPAPKQPPPPVRKPPDPDDEDWSDFWKEVP